jgi:glycosyltransferase involved in cell wall biosynthesis
MQGTLRVCIAVPTFRRPPHLAALLRALALQEVDWSKYRLRCVVIDNDLLPTAKPIVDGASAAFRHSLSYVHVPEPGLSVVRNAALNLASGSDDLLVMIDDDEVPEPAWLAELLRVQAATGADAVVGPVLMCLPPDAPRWVKAGRFFELPRFADSVEISEGYTGNCLLVMSSIGRMRLQFDRDFNLLGGEDQLFFRQMVANGGKIAFAAGAIVTEKVPLTRATLRYLAEREFRKGNTLALCDLRINRSVQRTSIRFCKGIGLMGASVCALPSRLAARGGTGAAKSIFGAARALGMLAGLVGYRYRGYSRARTIRVG